MLSNRVADNVRRVIVGKDEEVRLTLLAMLCEGHLLIEDVPGVGKTMLARALALSVGCTFRRIQFTPDMLPTDVTGVNIYNQKTQEFEFRPGPIFAQIVLDRRDQPRHAQDAVGAAGSDGRAPGHRRRRDLPDAQARSSCLATQNPIEYEGTFPLPEAQVDRFMMRIHLGYPSKQNEIDVLNRQSDHHPIHDISQVITADELVAGAARDPHRLCRRSGQELYRRSRHHHARPSRCLSGRQPAWQSGALQRRTRAGRPSTAATTCCRTTSSTWPKPTLAHRLIVSPSARIKNVTPRQVVEDALQHTAVPGARATVR